MKVRALTLTTAVALTVRDPVFKTVTFLLCFVCSLCIYFLFSCLCCYLCSPCAFVYLIHASLLLFWPSLAHQSLVRVLAPTQVFSVTELVSIPPLFKSVLMDSLYITLYALCRFCSCHIPAKIPEVESQNFRSSFNPNFKNPRHLLCASTVVKVVVKTCL